VLIPKRPVSGSEVNLKVVVWNGSTWVPILGDATEATSVRGGSVGIAGIASVEVGSFSINILDMYDPAQTALLSPNQDIVVYVDNPEFATPRTDGAIFTGKIQDIQTNYFLYKGKQHVNVGIYAVDAVSSHAGITVTNDYEEPGVTSTRFNGTTGIRRGYQRWEDRVNQLAGLAKTTVPSVTISSPTPIYNI